MKLYISRYPDAGTSIGGHVITETFAFPAEFPAAAVRLQLGPTVTYLSRDEAHEIAAAIMEAASDG